MKKQLPLKDIRTDGGTQQRDIDDSVVARYAELMKDGNSFEPIDVISDGKSYFLWDGFHRFFATKKRNKNYISAIVEQGTQRKAQELSFGANTRHGFPRQPGTGKSIILKIFADPEWSKKSEVDIAKWVGVTQQYVSKIKREIESHPTTSCRIDSDSEPKNKVLRSETIKVKRGESEYKMKKPEKKVLDSTGKQVPEHLIDFFKRANEYRQMIKQLNDMLKTVRNGKDANDLFYKYIKIENLTAEIGNVKRIFRFALPYAICRYCGGDEKNAECRACGGCGFVNEATYLATPRDLK